jgi:hypothetical protein
MTPGARVIWRHVPRGGYGFATTVDAEVVRVGPKRVLVRVALLSGELVERWVSRASLARRKEEST